jgi:hypothetical protein
MVEGVVLKWMLGETWEKAEPLSQITAGFGGSAEESGAGGPSHLECSRDDQANLLGGLAWELREDVTELLLLVCGDAHPPETVLDVKLAE